MENVFIGNPSDAKYQELLESLTDKCLEYISEKWLAHRALAWKSNGAVAFTTKDQENKLKATIKMSICEEVGAWDIELAAHGTLNLRPVFVHSSLRVEIYLRI